MPVGSDRVRVYIADDHPLYREGLKRAIADWPEFELAGEGHDGREALSDLRTLRPDVGVLDVRLPGLDGVAVVSAVARDRLGTRVLLLSAVTESAVVFDALAAGASGYLAKDLDRRAICQAVARVARGQTVIDDELQGGLASQIRSRGEPRGPVLTSREREVLARIAAGATTPQIAKELYLSPATVKTHLQHLYEKLEANDRPSAVAQAMRRGLLE